MHGRLRRFGRAWLDVAQLERLRRLHPEPLGPGLGADAPGRRMRPTFHRPRSVAPDMDNLDHSALADPGTASPWCAELEFGHFQGVEGGCRGRLGSDMPPLACA